VGQSDSPLFRRSQQPISADRDRGKPTFAHAFLGDKQKAHGEAENIQGLEEVALDNSAGLGLMLVDNDRYGMTQTAVLGFTDDEHGHTGPAERSGRIAHGDIVVSVNGRPVQHLPYAQVLEEICRSESGVVICFARGREAAARAANHAVSREPRVWHT
jgi:C-terminal processing protease CtpA/Prc